MFMFGVQHPFLVELKFSFQTSGKLYLILEYLPGGARLQTCDSSSSFACACVVYAYSYSVARHHTASFATACRRTLHAARAAGNVARGSGLVCLCLCCSLLSASLPAALSCSRLPFTPDPITHTVQYTYEYSTSTGSSYIIASVLRNGIASALPHSSRTAVFRFLSLCFRVSKF